ncbi:putative NBD/HSP70 family sugar kinase [Nocardioides luteus]|uniref:Transcriptional regulator n=1 Tax=Nocardioides luteus TaxID=1844 RepID=A0ABQ5SSH4_9ACTN|nr:ROK family transcriptional regulator [Nocardioides luteus]MDR7311224.1 putative NBD/HSP70 family sugar kinase [Nocardioides luteus]GGR63145.1 transcriptional regulator [Nocardioides luteus]GLJ66771.1 transcriptional regulator [Nocardioides luteus]
MTTPESRLRVTNRSQILDLLGRSAPVSRAELAQRTGLSRSTVSSIVQELLAAEKIVETSGSVLARGGGRPPSLLTIKGSPGTLVAVDIGHRHVRVAIADLAANPLAEEEIRLDADNSPVETIDRAAALVRECLAEAGIDPRTDRVLGVGMGIPGPVDPHSGLVVSPILANWMDLAPGEELSRRLGMPVQVENDANLGALAEIEHGAARDVDDVIYVKASSGIGAGLVLAGELYRGVTGIAGEIGHVRFEENGPICRCGNRGCLEKAFGGSRLVELLQPAYEETLTVERMLELAQEGDIRVNRILDDAGRAVGRVLADLCNHLNPALIVVGDTMRHSESFVLGIKDSIDRFTQPDTAAALDVVPSELGDNAGVMGALVIANSASPADPGTI